MHSKIKQAIDLILARFGKQPVVGLILGSGLGAFADCFKDPIIIPLSKIPHFPVPSVPGHPGKLTVGSLAGVPAVALQGRVHLYEGYSIEAVAFGARVLGSLGIRRLVVTNVAGGINTDFRPGDLMLISDHINMMGTNPLIGPNLGELGPRFPDMSDAYDSALREIALEIARQNEIPLRQGVYIGLRGPSYETPAEIRMCRTLGADAVGMSTIPEVIVANHMGIGVLGISCITNMAAGLLPQKLTHTEVLETANRASGKLQSLLLAVVPAIAP